MTRYIRYILWTLAIIIVLAGGLITYVFFTTGGEGTSYIEEWIGAQIKSAAQQHLNVKIDFEKPDYQYPKTVVLENIRLTSDDPASPGKSTDIMTIRRAKMTLGEIPSAGQPLHIENVVLDDPVLRFIATGKGAASFIGFTNLIKPGDEPETPSSAPPAKITDVFRIRLIQLNNGRIVYDPRSTDKRAMDLDQINCRLDVQPDKEGWYMLQTTLGRAPIFGLDIDGRFNINDSIIELAKLTLRANLGDENNRSLPPQLQAFLADHAVRGSLTVTGKGTLMLSNLLASNVSASIDLDGGNLSVGDYLLYVATMKVDAALANEVLSISRFDVNTLGGTLSATGQLALNDSLDASLKVQGRNLNIDRLLRVKAPDADPLSKVPDAKSIAEAKRIAEEEKSLPPIRPEFSDVPPPRTAIRPETSTTSTAPSANTEAIPFAGKLEFELDLRAPLSQIKTQTYGNGRIMLTEGRVSSLPVISEVENAIAAASELVVGKRTSDRTESALFMFNLRGDRVDLTKIDYRSTLIAARGVGTVAFADGKLDMALHGGPIEKLQSLLGPVGDWTAIVTDRLMGYKVTGTTDNPKVDVVVAGGVLDKIGNFFQGK
ncbi:MAG: AsmA family protein [Phycisphaeraceae bacterium]